MFSRDTLGRICGLVLFTVMFLRQCSYFPGIDSESVILIRWFLITILFMLFLSAYIIRGKAKESAHKIQEIILPLVCAGLPFVIILFPSLSIFNSLKLTPLWKSLMLLYGDGYYVLGLIIMAVGEIITVIGMLSLKRSFSILSEVREFVTGGLYRFVRHPLYCGEIISMLGVIIINPCHWTLIGVSLFILLQSIRAKIEESKISSFHSTYHEYKKRTGFLFPSFPGYKKK